MKITPASIPNVLLIEPRVFRDARGYFLEEFRDEHFAELSLPSRFRQVNRSRSCRNTLRGLHYQLRHPQGKLVSVAHGAIYDVAVDIRVGSPHFGRHVAVTLTADEPRSLWIPPGFAHGFCALSDSADVLYSCTDIYHADDDHGVLWCDPGLAIDWPVETPLLSPKDETYEPLHAARTDLPRYK